MMRLSNTIELAGMVLEIEIEFHFLNCNPRLLIIFLHRIFAAGIWKRVENGCHHQNILCLARPRKDIRRD